MSASDNNNLNKRGESANPYQNREGCYERSCFNRGWLECEKAMQELASQTFDEQAAETYLHKTIYETPYEHRPSHVQDCVEKGFGVQPYFTWSAVLLAEWQHARDFALLQKKDVEMVEFARFIIHCTDLEEVKALARAVLDRGSK